MPSSAWKKKKKTTTTTTKKLCVGNRIRNIAYRYQIITEIPYNNTYIHILSSNISLSLVLTLLTYPVVECAIRLPVTVTIIHLSLPDVVFVCYISHGSISDWQHCNATRNWHAITDMWHKVALMHICALIKKCQPTHILVKLSYMLVYNKQRAVSSNQLVLLCNRKVN